MEYMQTALGTGNHFTDKLKGVTVHISQEAVPTFAYDTSDEFLTIGGAKWVNVLDGENKWLGPNSGAVGFTANETGMGVAKLYAFHAVGHISYEQNLIAEGACKGVQCPETATSAAYNSVLPNGRDEVATYAESAAGNFDAVAVMVNVDGEKPHGVIFGWSAEQWGCH
jgi:hypothetical protein